MTVTTAPGPIEAAVPRLTLHVDVTDIADAARRELAHRIATWLEELRGGTDIDTEDVLDDGGWTRLSLDRLLTRLAVEAPVQAEAIKRAVRQGGIVTRAEIYDIGGYDPDRALKGFTRPVRRVCKLFQDKGLVGPDATVELLEPIYDYEASGYQRAGGFRVPSAIVELLAG